MPQPPTELFLRDLREGIADTGARAGSLKCAIEEQGADLSKVVTGHSGDTTGIDYLMKLVDAGSYLGMDRFGLDVLLPFEERVATVLERWNHRHISEDVIPALLEDGASEQDVETMLVANPRAYFER